MSDSFLYGGMDVPQPTDGTKVGIATKVENLTQLAKCEKTN